MDPSAQFTALLSHIKDTSNDYNYSSSNQLTEVQNTIDKLDSVGKSLIKPFGFEGADSEFEDFTLKLKRQASRITMNQAGYPQELIYDVLASVQENTKLPAFVIYDLDDCDFALEVGANDNDEPNVTFDPELPEAIASLYRPAIIELAKISAEKYSYNIIDLLASFRGFVSQETRKKIQAAIDSGLFNEFFVITDAPVWKINETVVTRTKAVIVGWVEDTAQMFIIDIFDPLPIEDYLKSLNII